MARIFSIQFRYDNALKNALISVHQTAYHTEYKITMLEDDIITLLPGNKVISTASNHFVFPGVPSHTYSDLMKEIIKQIASHIHMLQA